jgi:pimeloyl-ACP methyl ester carboxylesterase
MYRHWTIGRIIRRLLLAAVLLVVVLNWTWGRIPKQPPVSQGTFAQVGSTRVHYVEHKGSEPTVVMLHGLPGTLGDWQYVNPLLKGRHTIVIDRPGYGYSTTKYEAYDQQLATLHQFLAQKHVSKPVVAGHSYGGTLALGYAHAYPRDVRSIVLVDPGIGKSSHSKALRAQARLVQFMQLPVIKPVADVTFSQLTRTISANMGAAAAFDPNPVNANFKTTLLNQNMQSDDLKSFASESLAYDDVTKALQTELPGIKTRAVIIQGRSDKDVPLANVTALQRVLPNSTITVLSGGHMQPYVHAAAVAAAIARAAG